MSKIMNPGENDQTPDDAQRRHRLLRRCRRLLRELASLADHASLTGSMRKGAADAAATFNQVLARIGDEGIELDGLIAPLPEDASFDRVGVASRLLEAVLDDEMSGDEDLARDVRVLVGQAKGLDELGRIQDIGAVLREHLPDFLKAEAPEEATRRDDRPGGI